jgi:predicted DNA-binding transcriptional regulator YafY
VSIVTQESGEDVKKEFSIRILSHARQISETFRIDVPVNTSKEFEVMCSAYNEEWVVRSISGLNNSAVVSNPPALRRKIAEQAKRALKIYE